MKCYYGKESVIPVYIEVEDGERLIRAIRREQEQETPKYKELCRRFLADEEDFSEEKIKEADIQKRFVMCRKYYKIYKFHVIVKNSFEWLIKYGIMTL